MKFATWNCAMALQKKFEKLLTLEADILVVQECSRRFIKEIIGREGWTAAWFGKNPNKGLAVLVRAPWTIREANVLKPRWAGKVLIDGPAPIALFPVWACKSKRPAAEYIEQVHLLLDIIEKSPLPSFTIVAGDFNSNTRWDGEHRLKSHSAAVDRFRGLGLESAYHFSFGEPHGAERRETFWFTRNKSKTYHIDYAFLSRALLPRLKRVEVGHHGDWLSLSDHAPVLVELDL